MGQGKRKSDEGFSPTAVLYLFKVGVSENQQFPIFRQMKVSTRITRRNQTEDSLFLVDAHAAFEGASVDGTDTLVSEETTGTLS